AAELRRARKEAGYTAARVAKELNWRSPKVTRMETTEAKRINPGDLDKLMHLYEIEDSSKRQALHALAKDAKNRGWWSSYEDIFGEQALPDFEAEASVIRSFEGLVVPGLLQTPAYAEALFQGGRYTNAEDIAHRVEARMARREI